MNQQHRKRRLALQALFVPVILLVIIWSVHLYAHYTGQNFYKFGIHPRHADGLLGILLSPFLHSYSDWAHVINNSLPVFVLSWGLFYFYRDIAFTILAIIWGMMGLCVWLSGDPNSYHIGISGVIYGLAFFLFFSGVFRKNKHLLALSLLVVFEYGGMVWGVLPLKEGVSWESHLYGGVVGIILAYYYKADGPKRKKYQWEIEEELGLDDQIGDYWKTPEQLEKERPKIEYHYKEKNKPLD